MNREPVLIVEEQTTAYPTRIQLVLRKLINNRPF